ncbi:MAG: sulfurtransferase [Thermomicrobiales bacterium]
MQIFRAAPAAIARTTVALIVVGLLAACSASLPYADPADVGAYPGNGGDTPLLVDAAWLSRRIASDGADLAILDLSPLRTYRAGHVPGAIHAWWQDTMELNNVVYGVILSPHDPAVRENLLKDLGIGPQTMVVAYDNDRGRWAARMVWFLRFLGHERTGALDGGLAAWRGSGGSTDRDAHTGATRTAAAPNPTKGLYLNTEQLRTALAVPGSVLVDVRTPDEARDTVGETLPSGRIPGSVSVPWTSSLRDGSGRLESADELLRLFAAAGVTPGRSVILYARFGVETDQTWLVLKLLGFADVAIYDRGWAGWTTTPDLPVEPLGPPTPPS